ncbi:MAG: outer membrane beta-barrel protein [Rikenellaceae bacterium]
MNRLIKVIAVLAVALSSTALTASAKIPFLMYGASAGLNVSNVKLSTDLGDLSTSDQLGYQVGGMVGLDLPLIELTAEALWVHNKMNLTDFADADITCNTIECPILVSLPILGPLRIKAGPSFNIPINARANYADGYDSLGAIKSTVGYAVGLGLNLFNLTFDVRYNGQFNNQDTVFGVENISSSYDVKVSSFSASIGYRF